jgi:hypothetical protein
MREKPDLCLVPKFFPDRKRFADDLPQREVFFAAGIPAERSEESRARRSVDASVFALRFPKCNNRSA